MKFETRGATQLAWLMKLQFSKRLKLKMIRAFSDLDKKFSFMFDFLLTDCRNRKYWKNWHFYEFICSWICNFCLFYKLISPCFREHGPDQLRLNSANICIDGWQLSPYILVDIDFSNNYRKISDPIFSDLKFGILSVN